MRGKLKCWAGTDPRRMIKREAEVAEFAVRRETGMSRSLWAAPVLLCAGLMLASCGEMGRLQTATPAVNPVKPNRTVAQTPAAEREHERSRPYGGAYDDPNSKP